MKMLDTNVLLYAINKDSEHHAACADYVESMANGVQPWALCWKVIYEFLRVSTHQKVFPSPLTTEKAFRFCSALIKTPCCHIVSETSKHVEIVEKALNDAPRIRGNLVHDLHIAVLMREHGIEEIVTYDQDFKAFPWITIFSPAAKK